jgi:hypothetical protein
MTGACSSCGGMPWLGMGEAWPFFVVRTESDVRYDRPVFVRLCPRCLERTVKGGCRVERDILGPMSGRVYEEICRRLGTGVPETRVYNRRGVDDE